jgi:hypothetical protein
LFFLRADALARLKAQDEDDERKRRQQKEWEDNIKLKAMREAQIEQSVERTNDTVEHTCASGRTSPADPNLFSVFILLLSPLLFPSVC